MCLAIPGKVVNTYDQRGLRMAKVQFGSIVRAFTSSIREPGPGSCCLYAGHHLGSKRISPRFFPARGAGTGFDVI